MKTHDIRYQGTNYMINEFNYNLLPCSRQIENGKHLELHYVKFPFWTNSFRIFESTDIFKGH